MQSELYTLKIVAILLVSVLILGCANSIKLSEETVPTPLVQTLPKSMVIHYDESLQNSKTTITATSFGRLGVELIQAQNIGFDRLFSQLYEHTTTVKNIDTIPYAYDGLIIINLNNFEVIEQRKTSNTFIYFAKINYAIKIFDKNNNFSHSLDISGEGGAYDKNLVPAKLIREASTNALRDAFSSIALELIEYGRAN